MITEREAADAVLIINQGLKLLTKAREEGFIEELKISATYSISEALKVLDWYLTDEVSVRGYGDYLHILKLFTKGHCLILLSDNATRLVLNLDKKVKISLEENTALPIKKITRERWWSLPVHGLI